jgi:hypothetical protein
MKPNAVHCVWENARSPDLIRGKASSGAEKGGVAAISAATRVAVWPEHSAKLVSPGPLVRRVVRQVAVR